MYFNGQAAQLVELKLRSRQVFLGLKSLVRSIVKIRLLLGAIWVFVFVFAQPMTS